MRSIIVLLEIVVQGSDLIAGSGASKYIERGTNVPASEKIITIGVLSAAGAAMYLASRHAWMRQNSARKDAVVSSEEIQTSRDLNLKHETIYAGKSSFIGDAEISQVKQIFHASTGEDDGSDTDWETGGTDQTAVVQSFDSNRNVGTSSNSSSIPKRYGNTQELFDSNPNPEAALNYKKVGTKWVVEE